MKEKTNLFPSLIRLRETSRLKMAIAASIMLWCATPQQATADTNEEHAIEAVQQAKVKVKGTVVDETGEPMIGVAVKVLANNTGTITDLEGKFSVEAPLGGAIQISFIGYKTVTVKASSEPISVTLKEDSSSSRLRLTEKGECNRFCQHGGLKSNRISSGTKRITSPSRCGSGIEYVSR